MRVKHWKRWAIGGGVAIALGVTAGPYIYIHFIEGKAPPPLALSTQTAAPTESAAGTITATGTNGTWNVAKDSLVGYRVKENLFGQDNVAYGRTSAIMGSLTLDGTTVTNAAFTVDMTTVASDQSRRDNQFRGRIMETSTYPTATFTLTEPISLGALPAAGAKKTATAKGNLTMHGVTRAVSFSLSGQYTGSVIQVAGSIPIVFADYRIQNPSFGAVSTEDHGVLEFKLNLSHA